MPRHSKRCYRSSVSQVRYSFRPQVKALEDRVSPGALLGGGLGTPLWGPGLFSREPAYSAAAITRTDRLVGDQGSGQSLQATTQDWHMRFFQARGLAYFWEHPSEASQAGSDPWGVQESAGWNHNEPVSLRATNDTAELDQLWASAFVDPFLASAPFGDPAVSLPGAVTTSDPAGGVVSGAGEGASAPIASSGLKVTGTSSVDHVHGSDPEMNQPPTFADPAVAIPQQPLRMHSGGTHISAAAALANDTPHLKHHHCRTGIVADSVNDFSGTQGAHDWYYGYYTTPGDPASFTLMTNFVSGTWKESTSQPPWTMLWATGGHPNGWDSGPVHWAVRRWMSDVTDPAATITGLLAKANASGGDGTIGHIYVNGSEVFQHALAFNDTTGMNYSLHVGLTIGSTVDFVIDPNSTDYSDSTTFTAQISACLPYHHYHRVAVANSVMNFSGTQGTHDWYYGYYTTPADPASFTLMTNFISGTWKESTSQPPWTMLWATGGHPNGWDSGPVHWAVRRWMSDVTDPAATITGLLAKANASGGDGTIGHIYINGSEVFQHALAFNDTTGVNYSLTVPIRASTPIDFVIDPNSTDYSDSTTFTAEITAVRPRGFENGERLVIPPVAQRAPDGEPWND